MGTEYWLVDREGRHALDIDKAYALSSIVFDAYDTGRTLGHIVTVEMARELARKHPHHGWLALAIELWMRDVAQGHPVELWDDQTCEEWEGDDASGEFVAQPGWTLHQTHSSSFGHPLWRPPEVEATLAESTGEARLRRVGPGDSGVVGGVGVTRPDFAQRLTDILGFKPFVCIHCGTEFDEDEVHFCVVPRGWGYESLGTLGIPVEVAHPAPRMESPVVTLALLRFGA